MIIVCAENYSSLSVYDWSLFFLNRQGLFLSPCRFFLLGSLFVSSRCPIKISRQPIVLIGCCINIDCQLIFFACLTCLHFIHPAKAGGNGDKSGRQWRQVRTMETSQGGNGDKLGRQWRQVRSLFVAFMSLLSFRRKLFVFLFKNEQRVYS